MHALEIRKIVSRWKKCSRAETERCIGAVGLLTMGLAQIRGGQALEATRDCGQRGLKRAAAALVSEETDSSRSMAKEKAPAGVHGDGVGGNRPERAERSAGRRRGPNPAGEARIGARCRGSGEAGGLETWKAVEQLRRRSLGHRRKEGPAWSCVVNAGAGGVGLLVREATGLGASGAERGRGQGRRRGAGLVFVQWGNGPGRWIQGRCAATMRFGTGMPGWRGALGRCCSLGGEAARRTAEATALAPAGGSGELDEGTRPSAPARSEGGHGDGSRGGGGLLVGRSVEG
ncbi:hypothetical protein ACQJBY_068180 [Aegilops geniculata]